MSIRPLIGNNPVILIGTKADLLPSWTSFADVKEWLRRCALERKLNVIDAHLVSNRKKTGIAQATSAILRTRTGRDVYVMGLANVGKSAFVRAFLTEMRTFGSSNFTMDAHAKGRFLPVESSMPGTTLGIIKLQALQRRGAVYDTPGIHVFHRMTHFLTPEALRRLHPSRSLSAYVPPTPYEVCQQISQRTTLRAAEGISDSDVVDSTMAETACASYFWGGLVRIDIFEAPLSLGLVFFGAPALKVHGFPLLHTDTPETQDDINAAVLRGEMMDKAVTTRFPDAYESSPDPAQDQKQLDSLVESAEGSLSEETSDDGERSTAESKAAASGAVEFFGGDAVLEREEDIADISISGLPGWVSVVAKRRRDRGVLRGCIWAPKGIEVFLRTPIPVDNPLRNS